jgi:hypothetical protein
MPGMLHDGLDNKGELDTHTKKRVIKNFPYFCNLVPTRLEVRTKSYEKVDTR